jgi:cAMP-dependent protein kinase regulator
MQICDAIKTGNFHKDDYIIKEGEMGDVFYILEEGNCIATKTIEPGKPEQQIKEYKEGDYFGERALIKGEPRYANIVASSENVKVISLDRISFKRLLGPIEDILKRNMEKYKTFVQ